ncbi:hypothetical protein ABBQ32_005913 [Trebouxia sp. C0010 RCD-2024]
MYKVQQTDQSHWDLPNWKTGTDAMNQPWSEETGIVASAQCLGAPNLTDSLMDNTICKWTGSSDTTESQPAAAPSDSVWDPVPFAPQDVRSEVLDLFSVDSQPEQQDISKSAPDCSDPTSTGDPNAAEQKDASDLSRARTHPSTAKQKQANARESQRRFRLRQKARSQAIEAQLADTVAELCKLRVRQQQLESRNMLLEKCSRLSNKQKEDQLTAEGPYEKLYLAHETDASENGHYVTLSLHGRNHSMTVQEISVMPVAEFAYLWTEYIRETGACLIQLGQTQDKAAQARMEKLAVEASRLLGCVKLLNHDVHKAMLDGKLDPSSANTHRLGTAFYTNLTRLLTFSEEQMRDIMHLRRIYVTRRGLHAMERRALLSQAPVSHHQIPLPSDNLTQLSDLASQLKKNAADDYRVYHRIACALRRGVYTTKQWAILMVQSYPYLGVMETHLEVMAADRGEPSRAELLASAQTNTLAAEWRHLNNYLEGIASKNSHDYIPFAMSQQVQPAQSVYAATADMSLAAEAALNLQYV